MKAYWWLYDAAFRDRGVEPSRDTQTVVPANFGHLIVVKLETERGTYL